MIDTLAESGDLLRVRVKRLWMGMLVFIGSSYVNLNPGNSRLKRGKPRLYGSVGCSAGAELCVSIA